LRKQTKAKRFFSYSEREAKNAKKKLQKTETIGVYKKHEASYYYSQIPFFLVPFLSPIFPLLKTIKNQTRPKTFLELF